MKLKDLLCKLRAFNPEWDVLCYCEDEGIPASNHGFRIFEIDDVESREAEKTRIADGIPSLILQKTKYSEPLVLIEISSDV